MFTLFRPPARARAALAGAGAAALAVGLLSIPAAAAAAPAAQGRLGAPADPGAITVSLTATRANGLNPLHPLPGGTITLTATANIDVGPTPWYIEILNSSGNILGICGGGTTCSADVTETSPIAAGQIAFFAQVALDNGQDVQATTADNPLEPSWLNPLTATALKNGAGVNIEFTDGGATTSAPWFIQIYDATRNEIVAICNAQDGCRPEVPGWQGEYPDLYDAGCQCGFVATGDNSFRSDTFYVALGQFGGFGSWPPPDLRDWADHPV